MQSLLATQEILEPSYQAHPVVSTEIMNFTLEHRVDASQLAAAEAEIKSLRNQTKEAGIAASKAEHATSGLGDKLGKINQDIGNLKTELKRKQDKGG